MFNLSVLKTVITAGTGRAVLVLGKHSPAILMGTGVVGVVGTVVLACRATLKVDEVLDEAAEKIEKIERGHNTLSKEKYTDADYKKDLLIVKVQTGIEFIKLYGPSVILGVVSIGLILKSHNILSKRNVALMAAYKAVQKSFSDYRNRVIEEFGVDKDRCLKNGLVRKTLEVTNEDGTVSEKTTETLDPNDISQYARFFDEASTQWSKTAEYNMTFVKVQQSYANDLLKSRGHVFLNEVYDMLGLLRSQAGAVVGWVRGQGDDFVDFGLFNAESVAIRDFVNGYERSILLDFNVSGVIYDMI